MVATARGRYVLIGSCKWTTRAGLRVLDELEGDRDVLGPPAARARLLIAARGFDEALVRRAAAEDVRLVRVDELF